MTKEITVPALLEVRLDNGEVAFCHIDRILASPDLQSRLLSADKRKFKRAVDKLRKHGMLDEIPYIGPLGGR
jgi:hypothetical protein